MNRLLGYIRRLASTLFKSFSTSIPVIIGLILLLLIVALWWFGPHWSIKGFKPFESFASRITATLILLLIPLFAWIISTRRKYQSLVKERKHEEAIVLDPCLPYLQAQERQLDSNLAMLKANSLSSDYLYQTPWYLVLGMENSGKTSLINRSNQHFSLTSVIRTSALNRNKDPFLAYSVDWWVGNEAIIIDPPGEIISQIVAQENETESAELSQEAVTQRRSDTLPPNLTNRLWDGLITWLDKNRSRRPLNGIIVTIDLPTVVNQPASQRKAFAVLIRSRLFELSQKLGTRLPLYLTFTKFDLLEGFDEFFSKLPKSVKEDVFGFTFTLKSVEQFDAWLQEFITQYDELVGKIKEQVFDAIGEPHTLPDREHLLSLIAQLAGMRNLLIGFLTEAFGSDNYTTPALIRGIYFSSVYQQGLLSNAFVNEASRTYSLKIPVSQAKEVSKGAIFFAQKLFKNVIYPEAGLAGDNIKVLRHKRKILIANSALAAMLCIVAIGGWQVYYQVNRDKSQDVLNVAKQYSESNIDGFIDTTGRNLLPPLNQIRSAVSVFGDYRTAWALKEMGLYEGRNIGPKVDEAYMHLLSNRFLPALGTGLVYQMGQEEEGSDNQLAALRVYRMIEDKSNRRPEIVENWMSRHWQLSFSNDGVVQEQLMDHLHYAMLYTQATMPQHQVQVHRYQQILKQIPMQQRVYMSIRSTAKDTLVRPLNLRNAIGPSFDIVFTETASAASTSNVSPLVIDALFTSHGFKNYYEPRGGDVADLAMIDEWVLGERDNIRYSGEDKAVLSQKITDLYISDYIGSWRRALNRFDVVDFRDIQHAVTVLQTVVGPSEPFKGLLETVRDNSEIYTVSQTTLSDKKVSDPANGNTPTTAEKTAQPAKLAANLPVSTAIQNSSLRITREFASLDNMLQHRNDNASSYEEVIKGVTALLDSLKGVQDSPERGKVALQLVLDRFELKGNDPISTVKRMASGLPEPMNRHVTKLAQQAEQVLMVEALRELETKWDAEVYRFYAERLASRYPFNPESRQDVALDDFERFFGPKGILQGFQNKYLNIFLRDNIHTLQGQGGSLVRTDVLDQIEKVNRIRDAFFNNRGTLNVQFTVQPLGMIQSTRSSLLNVDGQLIPYRHGPTTHIGLIWPNTLNQSAVSKLVLVNSNGSSTEISAQGPWSLYRLLNRGQIIGQATATSLDLGFNIGGASVRYRFTTEKPDNPLTQKLFNGFSLPRTLLNNSFAPKP